MQSGKMDLEAGLLKLYRAPWLLNTTSPDVQAIMQEMRVQPDDVIIELGAGDGRYTRPIARRLEKRSGAGVIFACDFSRRLVDSLSNAINAEEIDVHARAMCLGDVPSNTLPFEDESANTVLSVNAVQYLGNPMAYLKEIRRVLKPDGVLLIGDRQSDANDDSQGHSAKEQVEIVLSILDDIGINTGGQISLDGFDWVIRAVRPATVLSES